MISPFGFLVSLPLVSFLPTVFPPPLLVYPRDTTSHSVLPFYLCICHCIILDASEHACLAKTILGNRLSADVITPRWARVLRENMITVSFAGFGCTVLTGMTIA